MRPFILLCLLLSHTHANALSFPVCYDYECGTRQNVEISSEDWHYIRQPMEPTSENSVDERQKIRQTLARFEIVVGNLTGTAADLAENALGAGEPGQMDCIDESTNTETYLKLLASHALLQWHQVKPRTYRNKWIFDVHWAAVIEEKQTNALFAVDSWFLDNGQPPYIQALEKWKNNDDFIHE